MDSQLAHERDDILLYETPSGLINIADAVPDAQATVAAPVPSLVLYVVSLFGVHNRKGDRIDGDALIVRAPNQPDNVLLAAALNCTNAELPALLDRGGSYAVRQIHAIDGYRLQFVPN